MIRSSCYAPATIIRTLVFTMRVPEDCLNSWHDIQAPETIINWLKSGVDIPFHAIPKPFVFTNKHFSAKEHTFLRSEINRFLLSGVIVEDPYVQYISPISCVPKKNKKLRLIFDLRHLNGHVENKQFHYEDINSVLSLIDHNDKLVTIDVRDGFYHVPISKHSQQFLGFEFDGKTYKWCRLPFGLCVSPYFFCKTIKPIVSYLRSIGVKVSVYVDDFIVSAKPDVIEHHRDILLQTLQKVGVSVNFEKSDLVPSHRKEYIGYMIDTTYNSQYVWLSIPQKRITKLKHDIIRVLKKRSSTARNLARITGQCISMSKAVLPGKLLLRNLYRLLKQRTCWQDVLQLDKSAIADLEWWHAGLKSWNGRAVHDKAIEIQLVTDASSIGWGGFVLEKEAQGLWTPEESLQNSNTREMMAVLYSLQAFRKELNNKVVQVLSDNISTVANINFQGGPSAQLTMITSRIWIESFKNKVTLTAKYLAGVQNAHADYLSRKVGSTDWKLNPAIFKYLERLWGAHTIDRCASMTLRQLPVYNSLYFDPETSGVDCLAQQDWGSHNNFINPPMCIIPQILTVMTQQKATGTLIAPMWKSKAWYPTLRKMLVCPPIKIPNSYRAFISLGPIPEPMKNKRWKIFAWRISGKDA